MCFIEHVRLDKDLDLEHIKNQLYPVPMDDAGSAWPLRDWYLPGCGVCKENMAEDHREVPSMSHISTATRWES